MLFFYFCPWCSLSFRPHPRLADRQKCCGSADCKKQQKRFCHTRWKTKNKFAYLENLKDWRAAHPDYWRKYRELHPPYTQRNRLQTKIRKALSLAQIGLQKRIDILQLSENNSFLWCIPRFAKHPRSLAPLLYAKSLVNGSLLFERPP